MKRYERYQPSGTAWLGYVPAAWDVQKIGALFIQRKVKVSDTDYAPLSVSKGGIVPQLSTAAKTDDGDNRKLVCTGDFVINSRSDRKGSCGVSPLDGSVSLINIVLEPRQEWNSRYVHYLLRSQPFSEEYYRNGRGIVADLWTTRYSEMKSVLIPIPPRPEQDQIVRYLDWQVSKINKLIAAKKKQIDLLKEQNKVYLVNAVSQGLSAAPRLKNSGIAWLPQIPSTWGIVRGKMILEKKSHPINESDGVVTCFRDGQVCLRTKRRTEGFTNSILEIGYQGIEIGDLAIHGMDGFAGAIGISEDRGKCSPIINVCNVKTGDVALPYVCYYLRMMALNDVFSALATGIRERSCDLRWSKIANLQFALPPLEEQHQICAALNKQKQKTLQHIQKFEEQIKVLKDLRTRLISDVVTGQIDVRGTGIPDFDMVEESATGEDEPDKDEVLEEAEEQGE